MSLNLNIRQVASAALLAGCSLTRSWAQAAEKAKSTDVDKVRVATDLVH